MAYNHPYAEASKLFCDVIEKKGIPRGEEPLVGPVFVRLRGSGCRPPR